MKTDNKYARLKICLGFIALFICGSMVGIGITNWNHSVKAKQGATVATENKGYAEFVKGEIAKSDNAQQETLTSCQAVERVLLSRLWHDDSNCDAVNEDLVIYRKLVENGCPENRENYQKMIDNNQAILNVACDGWVFNMNRISGDVKPCLQIEQNLQGRLGNNDIYMNAEGRIERAKIYAVMAERGCPENTQKYTELAKQELEIARALSDDKLDEQDAIEVVETYKRLKMQQDAEEVFNKVKKLTNPAIDFIMQVEKIINE